VHPRPHSEEGASSVASVFGVAIFLGFLLMASQVLIHLYATSTIGAIAFDNARRAALSGGDCAEAVDKAGFRLQPGFLAFERDNAEDIKTLQDNGVELAEGIAGSIGLVIETDDQSDEAYREAWGDIPEVNF
jgi:hypothetical protein